MADAALPRHYFLTTNPPSPLAEASEAALLEVAFRARAHADALANAHGEVAAARDAASTSNTASGTSAGAAARTATDAGAKAAGGSEWRDGGNFAPQAYGQWRHAGGAWTFAGGKRIECEVCMYLTYMLIDRLGDSFSRTTLAQERALMCPRVGWVMRSGCDYLMHKQGQVVDDLIMKLIEPVDICKHLTLCPPDYYDLLGAGSMNGYAPGRYPNGLPPQLGAGAPVAFAPEAGILPPPYGSPFTSDVGASPLSAGGYDMYGNALPGGGKATTTGATPAAEAAAAAPADAPAPAA